MEFLLIVDPTFSFSKFEFWVPFSLEKSHDKMKSLYWDAVVQVLGRAVGIDGSKNMYRSYTKTKSTAHMEL